MQGIKEEEVILSVKYIFGLIFLLSNYLFSQDCAEGFAYPLPPNECNDCVCLPQLFLYNQSTLQAFHFIETVSINNQDIGPDDWVAAFNGDICVGARLWDTSICGGGMCDVPVMGDDGFDFSAGYLVNGDFPTYKIYDTSENIYYDTELPISSENCEWSNFNFCMMSSLESTDNYTYPFGEINSADYQYNGSVTASVSVEGYTVSDGDILGAFINGEIRGLGDAVIFPPTGQFVFLTMIYSNQPSGESINFKYYNYVNDIIIDLNETLEFMSELTEGDGFNPFDLTDDLLSINNFIVNKFNILTVFPNPFNPAVMILVEIEESSLFELQILDIRGQYIETIYNDFLTVGNHHFTWDASQYASGVYVVNAEYNGKIWTKKVNYVK